MKMFDIADIPELARDNVHIGNKPQFLEKINKLINGGHKKLQIVTDFDHTLTRHKMDNGNVVLTSFGMFRECPSIPQHYKDEDTRLSGIYKPIEADPHMPVEEKTKHMIDWYQSAHALLKGLKLPRSELAESGNRMKDCFRLGVRDMIAWSAERGVPVLVFSAGLGESVVAALQASQLLLPNVKVVSNFLATDENDAIIGIKGSVIHTYNKNEKAIKGTEYYELVRERDNVVLLGDNIGDAGMAQGMDHTDTVIKVLYEKAIKGTEYYELVRERDNVVLLGDNIGDAGMAQGMDHTDTVIKVLYEKAIKGTEYYELVRERDNVVLLGDNIGDAGMAQGMDHTDTVIKVGFLGHGADNLPNYLKHFDIVLVDEHSVDLVNAILKIML